MKSCSNYIPESAMRLTHALLSAVATLALSASAADTPLNAEKYPQDTPQKALTSLIKSLESKDYGYWVSNLMTPADSKVLLEKHGSLEKAVAFLADEKHSKMMNDNKERMQKMLDANKTTEGDENGVKWVRFHLEEKELQLEKQTDGRWCMNTRFVGSKKN